MLLQKQYNILRQPTRNVNIKIDLINENDVVVGSFEGIATDGNISIDASSTYRRTGNLTMVFDKKYNILPSPESKIWFNKRMGVSVGLKNYSDEIIWFNLGRFAVSEVDFNFSAKERTMSCALLDYCAFLDGNLGGALSHRTVIEKGTPISEAIKSILSGLARVSVEDMKIDDMNLTVPYTIEKEAGSTIYDLIMELMELYMGWTFYCNEQGIFVVEKIRDKTGDPIIESFGDGGIDLTLTTTPKIDFKNVKNSIYVWGRELEDGTQIKWNYKNKWARDSYSELNTLTNKEIGDICYIANENKSYMWNGSEWELLSFNVVPKYNIEKIGERVHVYTSDTIFTELQAQLRAEYELEQKSNMSEQISFTCVPIYYLQPLHKIYINVDNLIQGDFLIDSVSIPLGVGEMTINCHKLYY